MALNGYDCWCVFPPQQLEWNWDWDLQLHTLGVGGDGDAELQEATFFQATAWLPSGIVETPVSSEASSGYLEDAVAHCSVDRCSKRQRTAGVSDDLQCLIEGFWDPTTAEGGDLVPDLKTAIMPPEMSCSFVSEEGGAGASGRAEQQRDRSAQVSAAQGGEEAAVPPPRRPATMRAAAAPLQKEATVVVHCCEPSRAVATTATLGASCASAPPAAAAGKETTGTGVLYPFAVVKPLGLDDGCMTTLSDVNRRILKRPARPVRHSVGAFASGPATAHGFGLSGKAVVSLTKIRTGGKGTITIIRTRG